MLHAHLGVRGAIGRNMHRSLAHVALGGDGATLLGLQEHPIHVLEVSRVVRSLVRAARDRVFQRGRELWRVLAAILLMLAALRGPAVPLRRRSLVPTPSGATPLCWGVGMTCRGFVEEALACGLVEAALVARLVEASILTVTS